MTSAAKYEKLWKQIVFDGMGKYKQLGYVPAFKALQTELAAEGLKACTALSCRRPILSNKSGFSKHAGTADGLHTKCKACDHDPAAGAAGSWTGADDLA